MLNGYATTTPQRQTSCATTAPQWHNATQCQTDRIPGTPQRNNATMPQRQTQPASTKSQCHNATVTERQHETTQQRQNATWWKRHTSQATTTSLCNYATAPRRQNASTPQRQTNTSRAPDSFNPLETNAGTLALHIGTLAHAHWHCSLFTP